MINELLEVKDENQASYNRTINANRTWSLGKIWKENTIKFTPVSTCREILLNKIVNCGLTMGNWLVYKTSSTKRAESCVRFIKEVERRLIKLKKNRSHIQNIKGIFFINLNGFWKSTFRIGILTMLIRTGTNYNKNSFEKCLKGGEYFRNKKILFAAKTFLSGKIFLSKYRHGIFEGAENGFWVKNFSQMYNDEISKCFAKHKPKKRKITKKNYA